MDYITIASTMLSKAPAFFWWGLLVVLGAVLGILAWRLRKVVFWKVVVLVFGRESKTETEAESMPDKLDQANEPDEPDQAA